MRTLYGLYLHPGSCGEPAIDLYCICIQREQVLHPGRTVSASRRCWEPAIDLYSHLEVRKTSILCFLCITNYVVINHRLLHKYRTNPYVKMWTRDLRVCTHLTRLYTILSLKVKWDPCRIASPTFHGTNLHPRDQSSHPVVLRLHPSRRKETFLPAFNGLLVTMVPP